MKVYLKNSVLECDIIKHDVIYDVEESQFKDHYIFYINRNILHYIFEPKDKFISEDEYRLEKINSILNE